MRQTLWILVLLLIAGLIAFGARNFPGSAEFIVAGYKVTMSIYVFALALILTFMTMQLLWRIYRVIVNAPSRLGSWRGQRREDRALAAIKTATIALHEGRWAHADKAATIASRSPQAAGLAALIGATSAQLQEQPIAAQNWLNDLAKDADFADTAALQAAQIALHNKDASGALTALDGVSSHLRKYSERYRELLLQAHADNQHWHEILQITKDKRWQGASAIKNRWFAQAAQALCADGATSTTYLQSIYKDMPNAVRADDVTLTTYIQALLKRDERQIARCTIEETLKLNWRPLLLALYVQASDETSYTAQLKVINAWETAHPKDAELLSAAGQLCFKTQLWGRAKANFQNSLALQDSVAARYGLAQTYRAMGDVTHAQEEERKVAALASSI